jgi:hypothetical protein
LLPLNFLKCQREIIFIGIWGVEIDCIIKRFLRINEHPRLPRLTKICSLLAKLLIDLQSFGDVLSMLRRIFAEDIEMNMPHIVPIVLAQIEFDVQSALLLFHDSIFNSLYHRSPFCKSHPTDASAARSRQAKRPLHAVLGGAFVYDSNSFIMRATFSFNGSGIVGQSNGQFRIVILSNTPSCASSTSSSRLLRSGFICFMISCCTP